MVEAYLGDLFHEIRFGSMTMHQFATLAASYDSVLSADFRDIANLIVLPDFQPKKFNKNPRQVKWNKDAIIKCVRKPIDGEEISYIFETGRREERTTFSTNESLLLGGFICGKVKFGDRNITESFRLKLPLEVKIIESTTLFGAHLFGAQTVLLNMTTSLNSKGTEVSLPSAVLVRPGLFYRILIYEFPEGDIHYSNALLPEIHIDSDITIKFHRDYKLEGKAVGLISTFLFNRI